MLIKKVVIMFIVCMCVHWFVFFFASPTFCHSFGEEFFFFLFQNSFSCKYDFFPILIIIYMLVFLFDLHRSLFHSLVLWTRELLVTDDWYLVNFTFIFFFYCFVADESGVGVCEQKRWKRCDSHTMHTAQTANGLQYKHLSAYYTII